MDDAKTVWCGNLSDKVTEELLYELFLQAAPLEKVKIPTDKEGKKFNFAFITFKHQQSVDYVLQLFNGIRLYDKTLNVQPRNVNSYGGNKPPENREVPLQARLGNQFNRMQETRDLGPRGQFRDHRYEGPRGHFRDNYREDRHRDNSFNRIDDRDKYDRHDSRNDSNRRRQNYNDRRGNFNDRGNRRDRYY